jgi:hypothetical protein
MIESLKQFNGQLGDGSALSQNIEKLSPKAISRGIENYYQNMRLGIGRGVHKGKGWNSHGDPPALLPKSRGAPRGQACPSSAL